MGVPRIGMQSGVGGIVSPTISRKTTSARRMVVSRLTFDLEVDLLAGLDRQKEAEERDEEDEQTGRDEVDDVEEAAAAHVHCEGHVRGRGGHVAAVKVTSG